MRRLHSRLRNRLCLDAMTFREYEARKVRIFTLSQYVLCSCVLAVFLAGCGGSQRRPVARHIAYRHPINCCSQWRAVRHDQLRRCVLLP